MDQAMSRFDAVLFDLDGTLLDSIELILDSYRYTLEAHGLPAKTEADVLSGLGQTLEDQFVRWFGPEAPVATYVDTYIEHNLEVHDRLVRAYPGVNAVVERLHDAGTPLAVVTSKRRRGAEKGLAALGLAGHFGVLVGADDVERPKPDPQPVELALAGLGNPTPTRVAFVGDATHDLHAGQAAGVVTVAVSWGAGVLDELRAAKPDHLVQSADELAAALFT